jgi:hypothetical protein
VTILRREVRHRFTTIDNGLVEDPRLSPEELGLMVYLLSKPDNWSAQPAELMKRFDMGRDRCYRIIKDLIDKGWLEKRENRTSEGQFQGIEYIIKEENPLPGNPHAVKPIAENPDSNKDLEITKTENNKHSVPAKAGRVSVSKKPRYQPAFDELWGVFPKHPNASKSAAFMLWMKLDAEDAIDCFRGAQCYASFLAAERLKRPDYPGLHLATFISQRRWEAHLEARVLQNGNGHAPQTEEEKRAKIRELQLKIYGKAFEEHPHEHQ